ncbi:MAG TPA: Scr1 family TA system antitoxin-like transcriptional regulator [Pseudonocardiaceae bacterium]|nr:Scr1 family TA system antitoxin-like transcriptional regulator [Pseudonocardiaceae bacterium]
MDLRRFLSGYARTVIRAGNPGMDDAQIEQRVHVGWPPSAAHPGHRPADAAGGAQRGDPAPPDGGYTVMAGQLERLVQAGAPATVSLRVMPYSAGLHYGIMSGPRGSHSTAPAKTRNHPLCTYPDRGPRADLAGGDLDQIAQSID